MRIAFFIGEFPSLSETFILNQITGLIDRGHTVDIYATRRGDTEKVHPDVISYKLLERTHYLLAVPRNAARRYVSALWTLSTYLFTNPRVFIRALRWVWRRELGFSLSLLHAVKVFLPHRSYDVIHCHFGPNGLVAALLRDTGVVRGKLLTTFHGYDVNMYHRVHGPDVYRNLFERGDLFTVNTTFTGERAKALGCPEDRLVKLAVGVTLSTCTFRERSCSPDEDVRVLTVGRLTEKKGIKYAIRAIGEVLKEHPNVEYRIVGDGLLHSELQRLIDDLGIANRVRLLGAKTRDEVLTLYADSHLFILSSVTAADGDQEGQGLVLQEAQAMGLPILSTLHNGIPEGVLDGVSGFLVPERDVDALAERLTYLIENPHLWPEMGRRGRAFVEQHFDIEKLNDQLVAVYQKLIDGPSTSPPGSSAAP